MAVFSLSTFPNPVVPFLHFTNLEILTAPQLLASLQRKVNEFLLWLNSGITWDLERANLPCFLLECWASNGLCWSLTSHPGCLQSKYTHLTATAACVLLLSCVNAIMWRSLFSSSVKSVTSPAGLFAPLWPVWTIEPGLVQSAFHRATECH